MQFLDFKGLSEFLKGLFGKFSEIGHKHTTSDITDYVVDSSLSSTSTNPIQNKVINAEFDAVSEAMGALELSIDSKADASHNHNDIYETKTDAETKLAEALDVASSAGSNALVQAKSYTNEKVKIINDSLDLKADASTVDSKISTHNTSTSAHSDIRDLITGLTTRLNALADSDDTTLDQMSEIVAYIKANKTLIESITTSKINVSDIVNNLTTNSTSKVLSAAQGVAIKALIDALETELDSHTHAIADVSGLQSALDGKAASSHGTHVSFDSTNKPKMDGTSAFGTSTKVARADHVHPTDTSRASQSSLDSHTGNTTSHITSTERTNWNSAKTHADSAHAPSNAQANQNAFSNIKVGSTTISADTTTDTLELVGSNVTITPDSTNDKVTIAVADGSTSAKGLVQLTNSTSSTSTTTAATPSSVKSAYDLANTAKTNAATAQSRADSAYSLAESKADSLSDLGVTATATELNYVDGVTSNIQTQLNGKATSGHTHNYAGSSSAGGAATSALKMQTYKQGSTTETYGTQYQLYAQWQSDGSTLQLVCDDFTVKTDAATNATKATQDASGNTITSTYATKSELNTAKSNLQASIDSKAASSHTHDDRYYTEAEIDSKLSGKANSSHGNHVPTTQTANNAKFLRNDNTWQTVTPANIGAATSGHTHSSYVNQNAFSNVKVGDTTIAADTTTDTLTLVGSNVTLTPDTTNDKVTIGITKANVVSALGYTPPTSNTVYTHPTTAGNKHIPAGGSSGQILRWSADGTAVWGSDNNTDTNVQQKNGTTSVNRRVLLSASANDTDETSYAVKSANFTANPLTGAFYANGYDRIDITGDTLDIDTLTLSAGSPQIMRYIEKTTGGASNITNIPVTGSPFILDVELIRWASTTDYITKQTFVSVGAKANEYVRYCTSGTWDTSWTKRVFTDNNTTYSAAGSSLGLVKTGGDVTISSGVITVNDDSHNHTIANIDNLQSTLDGKAASSHTHTVSQISDLTATATELNYVDGVTSNIQSQLDSKAASSHGTHVTFSTTAPVMDGTASVGSATTVARSDHKHPVDTSRAAASHTHNYAGSSSAGGAATSAVKLATARTINGVSFDGTSNITHYGTCSTAAATAAKTVALTSFALVTGAKVMIKFTVTNTASSPTLNVNSTGAKSIMYRGAAITAGYLASGRVYEFVYDGTNWELVGDINTDNNTKNTAGSTNSSSKLFLIGATSQATNPQTYSHDTAYVGTDGCLYSGGKRVDTEVISSTEPTSQITGDFWLQAY